MRALFLTTLIAGLGVCAVAAAQPSTTDSGTLCLDGLGINHAPICHSQTATRLDSTPDICICEGPYQTVRGPWCAPGEKSPNESADYEHARLAAVHHGSISGFSYQGRRACIPLK